MNSVKIGITGGSGFHKMAHLRNVVEHDIETPFCKPSDKISTGQLDGVSVAFLPRQWLNHTLSPSEIPYLANIYPLKQIAAKYMMSFSAPGLLQKAIFPLDMVIPEQ